MDSLKLNGLVDIPGYVPVEGIDRQEYKDFVGQRIALRLVQQDLVNGNYPPGLILQDHTGAYQVFGNQGSQQWVWPLVVMVRIKRQ